MSSSPPWWQAVAQALVGREIAAPDPADQPPDAPQIAAWLTSHGVDSATLAAERTARLSQRRPWPHPVPEDLAPGIGTAQLAALVDQVCGLIMGRPIPQVQRPRPGTMSPHDQRLIADKPPHHG